jgi:hypothetical protein
VKAALGCSAERSSAAAQAAKQNRHRPKPMAIFLEIFEAIST